MTSVRSTRSILTATTRPSRKPVSCTSTPTPASPAARVFGSARAARCSCGMNQTGWRGECRWPTLSPHRVKRALFTPSGRHPIAAGVLVFARRPCLVRNRELKLVDLASRPCSMVSVALGSLMLRVNAAGKLRYPRPLAPASRWCGPEPLTVQVVFIGQNPSCPLLSVALRANLAYARAVESQKVPNMTENPSTDANESPQRGPARGEKPLQSWKEIAAYLDRDARTARRWEKTQGLPVRRHGDSSRASVYAYPSELDAWRTARKPKAALDVRAATWKRPGPALATAAMVFFAALVVSQGPILNPADPPGRGGRQNRDGRAAGTRRP